MNSTYVIKKMLPRLILAVIFVNLSWFICMALLDISNVLGQAVEGLMLSPFGDLNTDAIGSMSAGQQAASTGIILGVSLGITFFSTWALFGPMLLAGFFALIVGYMVLVLRQVLIILLIILAPIALVLWVFPSGEKVAKRWFGIYTKLLLMYPMIIALFASGRIFSAIANNAGASEAGIDDGKDLILKFFAIVGVFAPYFMIPFTFKFIGGAISQIAGVVNDRSRGVVDRSRKAASRRSGEKFRRDVAPRILARRSEMAGGLLKSASDTDSSSFRKRALRRGAKLIGGHNVEAAMSARNAADKKEIEEQIATGRDNEIRGFSVDRGSARAQMAAALATDANATGGGSEDLWKIKTDEKTGARTTQFKSLGGEWVNEADVEMGHSRWGHSQFAKQAALSYEMRKAREDGKIDSVTSRYKTLAEGDWDLSERQATGNWKGSTFENQGIHPDLKHTNWEGERDAKAFVQEMYDTRGSYQMSQGSAHAIAAIRQDYTDADDAVARYESTGAFTADDQKKYGDYEGAKQVRDQAESIARTFSMRTQMPLGATDDSGDIVGIGNGPGHVNDEISAFTQSVNDRVNARRPPPQPPTPTNPAVGGNFS